MLPFKRRLKKEDFKSIKNVFKKSYHSPDFSLKVAFFDSRPSRFAVIASLLVSKKATTRNKLKRRVKAIILKHIDKFRDNCANIVYAQKNAANLSFKGTEEELLDLFYKSGIFKKQNNTK